MWYYHMAQWFGCIFGFRLPLVAKGWLHFVDMRIICSFNMFCYQKFHKLLKVQTLIGFDINLLPTNVGLCNTLLCQQYLLTFSFSISNLVKWQLIIFVFLFVFYEVMRYFCHLIWRCKKSRQLLVLCCFIEDVTWIVEGLYLCNITSRVLEFEQNCDHFYFCVICIYIKSYPIEVKYFIY